MGNTYANHASQIMGVYDPHNQGNNLLAGHVYAPASQTTLQQYTPTTLVANGPMSVPKKAFIPKPTKFMKAVHQAQAMTYDTGVHTSAKSGNFKAIHASDAVTCFGKLRPLYKGRPQKWCEMLLRAGPSETQAYSKTAAYHYYHAAFAGLFVIIPFVAKQRRTRFRLTAAGMMLLDHYAGQHPAFAPFVAAYLPKKARDEIAIMSCDLLMGITPKYISAELEKAAAADEKMELARLAELQKYLRDQQDEMMRRQLASSQPQVWSGYVGSQTSAINPMPNVISWSGATATNDLWTTTVNRAKRYVAK